MDRKASSQLLKARIVQSGLTTSAFAIECVLRDPRTVRRWITGESPIPQVVVDWLLDPKPGPWPPCPQSDEDGRT